jgi:hypothetical protein
VSEKSVNDLFSEVLEVLKTITANSIKIRFEIPRKSKMLVRNLYNDGRRRWEKGRNNDNKAWIMDLDKV